MAAVRIVYCGAHSILEHDEVKLFHELGHEVFSIGSYIHPSRPLDNLRPPLAVPEIPHLIAAVDALGQQGHTDTLMAAKDMGLPDEVVDWADVIVYAALEHRWLAPNWNRLKSKRVIWRTIGQSGDRNEALMKPLFDHGCEIVRYSPKERNIPHFAGESALIRFYKDPQVWNGWTGEEAVVTNVTQSLYQRSLADDGMLQPPGRQWTSFSFWDRATQGLPTKPMGSGSDAIGGLGKVDWETMRDVLRSSRAYLYTGTQPASYTLGLIEAMMVGIPVVSITPDWFQIIPYGPQMFEGHEIAPLSGTPEDAHAELERILRDPSYAAEVGEECRQRAIYAFGRDTIAAQWQEFLTGTPLQRGLRANKYLVEEAVARVARQTAYVVGERKPEYFIPQSGGWIEPKVPA